MTPTPAPHDQPRFAIGVDYGTGAVRALVADTDSGEELAVASWEYAHGRRGVITDAADPNLARQHPADYAEGFTRTVAEAVASASRNPRFHPSRVVGIGIDTTGSTPLPLDADARPLALNPQLAENPAAMAWLWKDHTSHAEAAEITERAAGTPYLTACGNVYSSEWFWSKALRCARTSPKVFDAAHAWVELCDYIPALLTGVTDPRAIKRSICAAGHKGMYHPAWGGLPPADFLASLHPSLPKLRDTYTHPALPADQPAGTLTPISPTSSACPTTPPVAAGALDAHMGAIGAGVAPGTLVKILGTSTCDCLVAPLTDSIVTIPGVSGVVPESVLPGMLGIEAGQSAVGDIFDWYVSRIGNGFQPTTANLPDPASTHAHLTKLAAALAPGQSGLLALDWHNGNRNVLADPLLTGLILGQTLHTTPAETYRALIEATAFGARMILERLAQHDITIDRIVNCGGIADKSPLVMQIYADVCNRPMHIARSSEACALGAAACAAVVGGAHPDVPTAQHAMTGTKPRSYTPDPARAATYAKLFDLYTKLHDAFGGVQSAPDLGPVMKQLLAIRDDVRRAQTA
ncbi:MAG: ribulokinase [Planctomycetota bacterium]|nr:MAG: ribulokinase [Planctomycetota bacterium]